MVYKRWLWNSTEFRRKPMNRPKQYWSISRFLRYGLSSIQTCTYLNGAYWKKDAGIESHKNPWPSPKGVVLEKRLWCWCFFFKRNLKPGDNSPYGTEISGYWQVPVLWVCGGCKLSSTINLSYSMCSTQLQDGKPQAIWSSKILGT